MLKTMQMIKTYVFPKENAHKCLMLFYSPVEVLQPKSRQSVHRESGENQSARRKPTTFGRCSEKKIHTESAKVNLNLQSQTLSGTSWQKAHPHPLHPPPRTHF